MLKNHRLARSVADVSFAEFRRQVEYKAARLGVKVCVADRWFSSSKLCSHCGYKNEGLCLKDRRWCCPDCHGDHDRDLNAARNLVKYFLSLSTVSSTGFQACGEDFRRIWRNLDLSGASLKQEANVKSA